VIRSKQSYSYELPYCDKCDLPILSFNVTIQQSFVFDPETGKYPDNAPTIAIACGECGKSLAVPEILDLLKAHLTQDILLGYSSNKLRSKK